MVHLHIISTGYEFDSSDSLRKSLQKSPGLTDYICSIAEAREYLQLLLELSKTFEVDDTGTVNINNLRDTLHLLSIADIKLTDHDKTLLCECSTAGSLYVAAPLFTSPYLNAAECLTGAKYLIGTLVDLWRSIHRQCRHTAEAIKYEELLKSTPRRRLIQRLSLIRKHYYHTNQAEYWNRDFNHTSQSRFVTTMNELYNNETEHGWPAFFLKPPLQAKRTSFGDSAYEAAVRAEWERSPLHRFGDKRIWRMMVLDCGMNFEMSFCYPTADKESCGSSITSERELQRVYPEFEGLFRFDCENYLYLLPTSD